MHKAKRVVIVAGEESGDMHAAALAKELKAAYPDIIISGIGGKHMQAAGVDLVADLASYGVTGLSEVLRHLRLIRQAFKAISAHLQKNPPDLLILVDYPGFNLRLAKFAKLQLQLKILYYISPQIWAWKASRIHLIKQCVDKMAVILPFEKAIYQKAGVPVCFVGHPLVETMGPIQDPIKLRQELGLPVDAKIIALLPGSRKHEISRHMPVLAQTAKLVLKHLPEVHFVVPVAGTINQEQLQNHIHETGLPLTIIPGQAIACMNAADFVLVASGTASLECALLQKPMGIFYKTSFLTYHILLKVIQVRFLGLCNLLANTMLVPEFLQYDCNAQELARYVVDFHNNPSQPQTMINKLGTIRESLTSNKSDCSLFELVVDELSSSPQIPAA